MEASVSVGSVLDGLVAMQRALLCESLALSFQVQPVCSKHKPMSMSPLSHYGSSEDLGFSPHYTGCYWYVTGLSGGLQRLWLHQSHIHLRKFQRIQIVLNWNS